MANFLPPRPRYARERALYAFLMLFCFAATLALRLGAKYLAESFSSHLLCAVLTSVLLLCALVFMWMRGQGYARAIRWRRPHAVHVPLILSALFTLLCGALLLSILFGGNDTLGNSAIPFAQNAPLTVWQGVIAVPVLALLPAIAEELLFRGVLCAELDRRGVWRALLVGPLLFSLLHFDPANLPAYFFIGFFLTLVLYATDSLIATMLVHAIYSVVLLFAQRYLNALYSFTGNAPLFLFLVILVFLISLVLFCLFCAREYRAREQAETKPPSRDVPRDVQLYTTLDALGEIPVVLCFLLAIAGMILL